MPQNSSKAPTLISEWAFVRRVLIVVAIAALCAALWSISDILLLVFGAVLMAVVLRTLMGMIIKPTGMAEHWALLIVVLVIAATLTAAILLFGPGIWSQIEYLFAQMPVAVKQLTQQFNLERATDLLSGSTVGDLLLRAVSWGSTIFGAAASFVLVLVGGVYFALRPQLYREGFLKLIPPSWQERVSATMDDAGEALRRWLKAQLVAMAIVGAMTTIGMWVVGVPSPLALGLIAGLTEFVPIIGPILGAIPAVLLASTQGWELVVWALSVAIVVQQIESTVITPLVAGHAVQMPPAVGLFALVAIGVVFGPLGLLFGYPLAIVVDIAVRRLYVRETLGERVEIVGEKSRLKRAAAERKSA